MAKRRFTDTEIANVLREAEAGVPVREIIGRIQISEQTFYRWKRKFRNAVGQESWQYREIEEENRKLKQLVAELTLENRKLREILNGTAERAQDAPHRSSAGRS